MNDFRALVLDLKDEKPKLEVRRLQADELPDGEVTIRVAYSSINYKDAVVAVKHAYVKSFPLIPGIDLAGTVIASADGRFRAGDPVIVTSYGLGTSHHGGFSQIARVPAKWVVPLPKGLTLKEAMILGTAGFTAALSVQRLEDYGLTPEWGPVLVTGATGGVGSTAVDMLSRKGYDVCAVTGKPESQTYLMRLGAKSVIRREELTDAQQKPLRKEQWAAAIDPVGGASLQYVLSSLKYGGAVASSGLAGGADVQTTVYPFILRGISWIGIDSVYCPMPLREKVWSRLGADLKPLRLNEDIVHEISLEQVPDALNDILNGSLLGRTVVNMQE